MRLTRVLAVSAAAALLSAPLGAQQPKKARVKRCAASDSLRLANGLYSGTVLGQYYKDLDVTRFLSGAGRMRVTASADVDGKTWSGVPPVNVSVFIRGAEVSVVRADPPPYRMSFVLNDTEVIDLGPVLAGTFDGPAFVEPTIPLSALVPPSHLLSLVRAKKAVVRIGKVDIPVDAAEKADLASLYIILTCGGR